MLPDGVEIGRPAPIAAARVRWMRNTSRQPARSTASLAARRSTLVIPYGTVTIARGLKGVIEPQTLRRNQVNSTWATSKSAIAPSCSG